MNEPDWSSWLRSWDAQQAGYLADREERLQALVRLAASTGPSPRVLDLACGPGSISLRLLAALPDARVSAVDADPVLLRIFAGVAGSDPRIRRHEADLRTVEWTVGLEGPFDAILTATALHWLTAAELTALYAQLPGLLAPGGLFANVDHFPTAPPLAGLARALRPAPDPAAESWDQWWDRVRAAPEFTDLLAARDALWGGLGHPAELHEPTDWHVHRLEAAGFAAAGELWRRGGDALLVALPN